MRNFVLSLLCAAGCASTGDAGGGASHLPVSGAGPFQPLTIEAAPTLSAPFVLSDPARNIDEPTFVVRDTQLAAWVTVHDPGGATIQHADAFTRLEDGFGDLFPALQADQGWEAGAVTGPSIVWNGGSEWLLFYAGGGAIGWAVGTDDLGHVWRKAPGPALFADGRAEGNLLGPPAAVHVGDKLRLYYEAAGAIWAAEAPYADVLAGNATTWTRLDGDSRTPERDPMVRATPFAPGVGRAQARAAVTEAGRVRHDLYVTALNGKPAATVAFAASFTGDAFVIAPAPILPLTVTARDPAEQPYRDGAVLLYVTRFGSRDAIAAALSP
jgi:hypothetical protein